MAPFGFRVRADTIGAYLRDDAGRLPTEIDVGGRQVRLKVERRGSDRPDRVILGDSGFPTEEEARTAGTAAKSALRAAAVATDVPMDIGDDLVTSRVGPTVVEEMRRDRGVEVRPDVHGLDVFDQRGRPVMVFSASARGQVSTSVERLIDELQRRMTDSRRPLLDARAEIACELFLLTSFEDRHRARFINLITALEALAERPLKDTAALEFIDDCIGRLPVGLPEGTAHGLRRSLEEIRSISIGASIRALIDGAELDGLDLGDRSPKAFINHCYTLRSKLVHGEPISRSVAMSTEAHRLRQVVKRVLLSRI